MYTCILSHFCSIQLAEITCEASAMKSQLEQLKVGHLSNVGYDGIPYSRKFSPGENFHLFCPPPLLYPMNFLSCVNDCIEPKVIFTILWVKVIPLNYF